jgi:hypothetical protein
MCVLFPGGTPWTVIETDTFPPWVGTINAPKNASALVLHGESTVIRENIQGAFADALAVHLPERRIQLSILQRPDLARHVRILNPLVKTAESSPDKKVLPARGLIPMDPHLANRSEAPLVIRHPRYLADAPLVRGIITEGHRDLAAESGSQSRVRVC